MEEQFGHESPQLADSLNNEAHALRQLGRNSEAEALEERVTKIRRTAN
jgi:hypothetical protein